jgi:AraC-like DNA-binding protein
MAQARRMLSETDLPVSEIADAPDLSVKRLNLPVML